MNYNINNSVSVQLTDVGRAEHKRQHDELLQHIPTLGEYKPPCEDDEGWSKWQMWDLMERFGHKLRLGSELPFSPDIRIES